MDLKSRLKWDHDRQVAEDEIISMFFASLVNNQALFFGTLSFIRSIKANPSKGGDAKPWI
jgi:hypothetical protein